jgi:AraC-type DNA-binding domain-containing proteins
MTVPAYSSFTQWYSEGPRASGVHTMKLPGGILSMVEATQPAGDMSYPPLPELVLYQDLLGGSRVSGNNGGGSFDVTTERGGFILGAPNFKNRSLVETCHRIRSLSFPLVHWQNIVDAASDGQFSIGHLDIYKGTFVSPHIRSVLQRLWALSEEEGVPSRLLAQAAGCEILAELYRLSGKPFKPTRGGLAPWAERRCLELLRARLSEDVSLEELAAEARLSPFHFARMFKQSVGVPPRVYLTRLRLERACELLEQTDLTITEIALEVGYSSNQVFARVFLKHRRISPSDYRRTVRDPARIPGLHRTAARQEQLRHHLLSEVRSESTARLAPVGQLRRRLHGNDN